MSILPSVARSFQEVFCAQYGVPAEFYGATVLRLTLYPHARWLASLSQPELLAPDRHVVANVGRLTRWRGFAETVNEFQRSPENRRFWRRTLCLRVSVDRLRTLFSEVMGENGTADRSESWTREETQSESGPFVAE